MYGSTCPQALARVGPLRDFFLLPSGYASCKSPLVQRFGELMRKLWNPRNFKGQVSPHEFMQVRPALCYLIMIIVYCSCC